MPPKTERKLILSMQPLALHIVERTGWKHQRVDTFGAFDIRDALKLILKEILMADAELLAKMDRLDDEDFTEKPRRSRRYISKQLETIYLQKDEAFAKKYSRELYGYWFPTNIGFKELSAIFRLACEAAGIQGEVRQNLKNIAKL